MTEHPLENVAFAGNMLNPTSESLGNPTCLTTPAPFQKFFVLYTPRLDESSLHIDKSNLRRDLRIWNFGVAPFLHYQRGRCPLRWQKIQARPQRRSTLRLLVHAVGAEK
jgi:hypothetical protein